MLRKQWEHLAPVPDVTNGQDAHSTNGQDAHSTKLLKSSRTYAAPKKNYRNNNNY
ncbi:MAG: hypothetical protein F6K39_19940 [Okeania sp. SIO3B3]|nr:hypothetical protein [Okeania sp. SIO3B3]